MCGILQLCRRVCSCVCRAVFRRTYVRCFQRGEYICHQGDPSDVFYVALQGKVDVVIRRPDSKSKARGRNTGMQCEAQRVVTRLPTHTPGVREKGRDLRGGPRGG